MRYNDTVMDHFLNPRNAGPLPNANAVGRAGSGDCGDLVELSLRVEDDRVVEARFRAFGCVAAIAGASVTTELVRGRTVAEALALTNTDVVHALGGLPPRKVECSILAEEAIRAALGAYLERNRPADRLPTDAPAAENPPAAPDQP
ncbi:MAG: iron-sulfur cluster assembly scaffold protein [Verrucomicrobia bacterium]|nr:MAG: iron-sulfur cluster assembly scaffold protein [Verrucomicrobiota bacterium]